MYRFVVFDIDGTLIDTEKAILCALQKLLKLERKGDYSVESLAFVLGIPGHVALAKLNATDIEDVGNKWNAYLRDYESYIKVFPGVEETVRVLKREGIETGIVTSKTHREYESDFVPFNLHHLFDHVVCADDTLNHKPHPDPLLKVLELAGMEKNETIYIGDTIYDMECAQKAGVDFGLALWGARDKDIEATNKFKTPDEILKDLKGKLQF